MEPRHIEFSDDMEQTVLSLNDNGTKFPMKTTQYKDMGTHINKSKIPSKEIKSPGSRRYNHLITNSDDGPSPFENEFSLSFDSPNILEVAKL